MLSCFLYSADDFLLFKVGPRNLAIPTFLRRSLQMASYGIFPRGNVFFQVLGVLETRTPAL